MRSVVAIHVLADLDQYEPAEDNTANVVTSYVSRLLMTCVQDPEAFETDGGWNFLDMEGDDEEEEDEEEEGDPEFEAESDMSEEAASSDYRFAHPFTEQIIEYRHSQLQPRPR